MPSLVERYLKFAGASLCVLALGTCARLVPSDPDARRPEPRLAEPPAAAFAKEQTSPQSAQMAALEATADALLAQAADLRLALDVMGPLPDPGAGAAYAIWPDAAKPPGPRTTYRPTSEPTSISKAAAILFSAGGDTRLVVSSLPAERAHGALCVELAALAGACRPAAPVRAYR